MSEPSVRPRGQWPGWMDDLLSFGPIAELEAEWKAEIGDRITGALDLRAERLRPLEDSTAGGAE